ncbi:alpha-amylase family glycosyl hydrolase [Amaricoccus sp.]|uniref:alpha-amylase family glycosyl hydrolase n=1 Tax=Amaricoccus sp. TaxID=1872485 RepID=UPI0026318654|nr:alpha-amylase family glycosyl hydrolase [Amaricoccus sp.]HRO11903.1 alpha-amylase family glycosyl hydrolase [Amaricoccus sp.]
MVVPQIVRLPADPDWWRGAVIYQIYPRSFQDSNADGIGDLAGIIHRLPYVASLGVDAIWISPFFPSPMLDFGYDVMNYRDVDPMFGTIADFEALIERAHELGLRVMIDLVLSHTSDQHRWFRESRSSRDNPKADWYVWADAKPDGTAPNNWLSIFGGPGWEWDSERLQYYQHNFLKEQPDLNFHEPEVQEELLAVARFWLERGVDGFRLDTINFYFCDAERRDNPVLPVELRDYSTAPAVNPYNWQEHLYDKSRPEMIPFLRRFRAVMSEFGDIAAVGEVGDAQRGMEIMGEYTRGDDLMQMCYAFEFLSPDAPSGRRVGQVLRRFAQVASDGWACWAFSNHDVERHATRWRMEEPELRVYLALILSLRGSVCLYQGEELGLTEAYVPFEELQDPYGKRFWPKFRGRDGCRTPMPWLADNSYAGFSDVRPWLPVAPEHVLRAVSVQEGEPESMLNFYRRMLAWRKARPALAKGGFALQETSDSLISYVRTLGAESVFCAFNLGPDPIVATLPEGAWRMIEDTGFAGAIVGRQVELPPFQAVFAEAG